MKTMIFSGIQAIINRDFVLRRMKYKKNITLLTEDQLSFVESSIAEGISLLTPRGVMGRFEVIDRIDDCIIIENGIRIKSKSLAKLLKNSTEVLFLAATAGNRIVERIHNEINNGDAALGVIMDSVASEAVDASLGWIKDFAAKLALREGKIVTRHRYSPGFSDFSIDYQKNIYEALQLQNIGLKLTEKYMLLPEKSAIAVTGIEIRNDNCR